MQEEGLSSSGLTARPRVSTFSPLRPARFCAVSIQSAFRRDHTIPEASSLSLRFWLESLSR